MIITFIFNFITIVVVASPNAFAEYQEIYNKTHMLQLKSEDRTIKTERITTVGELDTGENKFRFSFYTKDFDKQDWTEEEERIPLHIRHASVAPQYMGMIILHPESVQVGESKQKAFLVRENMFSKKYRWEELIPYEDNKNAQIAMGIGEKVVDELLSKIPFAKEGFKSLLKYCAKKNKEYYDSIFKEKASFVATMIPLHIPKAIIGFTETAMSIEIPFDLRKAEGEQKLSFWINPAFGNPSINYSEGTWSPGFGRLEGTTVNFTLKGKSEIKEEEEKKDIKSANNLDKYFLRNKHIKIKEIMINGIRGKLRDLQKYGLIDCKIIKSTILHPFNKKSFYKKTFFDLQLKCGANTEEIEEYLTVIRKYNIPTYSTLVQVVYQFKYPEDVRYFLKKLRYITGNPIDRGTIYIKDNILSCIYHFDIWSEEQAFTYIDSMLEYIKRINPEIAYIDSEKRVRFDFKESKFIRRQLSLGLGGSVSELNELKKAIQGVTPNDFETWCGQQAVYGYFHGYIKWMKDYKNLFNVRP